MDRNLPSEVGRLIMASDSVHTLTHAFIQLIFSDKLVVLQNVALSQLRS